LLLAGLVTACGEEAIGKPEFRPDGSITCGAKSVQLRPNGMLLVVLGNENAIQIDQQMNLGAAGWTNPSRFLRQSFKVDARKRTALFRGKIPLTTDPTGPRAGYRLSLQLMDDGLVNVKTAYFLPKGQPRIPDDNLIFQIPFGLVAGRTILIDGQKVRFSESDAPLTDKHRYLFPIHRRDPKTVELFHDEPDRHLRIGILNGRWFIVREQRTKDAFGDQCAVLAMNGVTDEFGAGVIEFTLDIRRATPGALARSPGTFEGIDFYKSDRLHIPRYSRCQNLIQNPSFEAGLRYWHYSSTGTYPEEVKEPYVLDTTVAHSGRNSVRCYVAGARPPALATFAIPTEAGRSYTFSFYAKAQYTGLSVSAGSTTAIWEVFPEVRTFPISGRWKRYSHTFVAPNNGLKLHLRPGGRVERGEDYGMIWVDDVQFEKLAPEPEEEVDIPEGPKDVAIEALEDGEGDESEGPDDEIDDGEEEDLDGRADLTDYAEKPVILDLLTARRDHLFQPGKPIQARMVVKAEPEAKGKLSLAMEDFESVTVWEGSFDFVCKETGEAEIALPLGGRLPRGIFYLTAEVSMADGFTDHDFFRITVMDFLENKHKHRNLCGTLPWLLHPDRERYLRRFRDIGIGSMYDYGPQAKTWYESLNAQGLEPAYTCLFPRNRACGIGLTSLVSRTVPQEGPSPEDEAPTPDEVPPQEDDQAEDELPLEDEPTLEEERPSEEATQPKEEAQPEDESRPDFEETIAEHCRKLMEEYPYLKRWKLLDEPWGWARDYGGCDTLARIAEVAYKAVKEANPDALVMTHTPCGMEPRKGIRNLNRYLAAGGIKHADTVGTNCYRPQPENPDLDADIQTLLAMLKRHGYEGEFHLCGIYHENYSLPAYGLDVHRGCSGGHCRLGAFSYHGGWGERMCAAYTARSWLIGYKYADRLRTFIDWSYDCRYLLDIDMVPYAVSVVPNTLGLLLGNADFVEDIAFEGPIRGYLFRDERERPVAAIWPVIEEVDRGIQAPPVMRVSGADASIEVLNLMGAARDCLTGDQLHVSLTPYPTFLRGAPGSLARVRSLLKNAEIAGIRAKSRGVRISARDDGKTVRVIYHSRVPRPIAGKAQVTLGERKVLDQQIELLPQGKQEFEFPIGDRARPGIFSDIPLKATFTDEDGQVTQESSSLRVLGAARAPKPITADGDLSDWEGLPAIDFPNIFWEQGLPSWLRNKYSKPIAWKGPNDLSARMHVAWDEDHLYLAFVVRDDVLNCDANPGAHADGLDCVELSFDTQCDARTRQVVSIDGNDYIYYLYPYQDGSSSAYRDFTAYAGRKFLAKSGPEKGVRTVCKRDRETQKTVYEAVFPKRYLHSLPFKPGTAFGFAAFIPDHDGDYQKRGVTMTNMPWIAPRGRPQLWPVLVLME